MIIDSHAHYSHRRYEGEFPYLSRENGDFCLCRGDRKTLVKAMEQAGIAGCIEAATSLDKIEDQLALAAEFAPYFWVSMGVHPKKCAETSWEGRKKLEALAQEHPIVAIGETGLDYAIPPETLDKGLQKQWFSYQIQLAHSLQLPLILHIREADGDALELLRQHKDLLHGGVAHCFGGDFDTAMAYIELGFAIGIGGRLLHEAETALQDAVRRVPLESILVETDAPYILPDIRHLPYSGKQRKKARNTSLILPAVLDKIAQLRGESRKTVEEAIYRNTVRIFRLEG